MNKKIYCFVCKANRSMRSPMKGAYICNQCGKAHFLDPRTKKIKYVIFNEPNIKVSKGEA